MTGAPRARPRAAPAAYSRRERVAVSLFFGLNGGLFGTWVSRIPAAADRVQAGPGTLGLALLSIAAGALLAMPLSGRWCARWGSRPVTTVAGVANAVSVPLLALAGDPVVLGLLLAVYGVASGGLDVAMNTAAVAAVRRARRPLMPSFHGWWSVGGMGGAALGGLAAGTGLPLPTHFALAAAAALAATAWAARHLPPDPPQRPGSDPAGAPTTLPAVPPAWRDPALVALGAVCFVAALGEGAMADWSALFLRDVLGTTAAVAAGGYTAFSVAMAAGRFAGGSVLHWFGPARVLPAGLGLAALGTLAVTAAPHPAAALAGFVLAGAGLSAGFPVVLNAAGAHAGGSGPAIGLVATVGYTGFLAGPPLVGLVAESTGLRVGLGLVAPVLLGGLLLARAQRATLAEADPARAA